MQMAMREQLASPTNPILLTRWRRERELGERKLVDVDPLPSLLD
jgi:hypothetical protein